MVVVLLTRMMILLLCDVGSVLSLCHVRTEDVVKIADFLEENSARFFMRTVVLTDEDCEILGILID